MTNCFLQVLVNKYYNELFVIHEIFILIIFFRLFFGGLYSSSSELDTNLVSPLNDSSESETGIDGRLQFLGANFWVSAGQSSFCF